MVSLRLMHPDHVIEQQIMTSEWSEPLVGETGPANHDCPKLSDLGMNPEFCPHRGLRLLLHVEMQSVVQQCTVIEGPTVDLCQGDD
jgi:hypothetical protein